MSRGSGRLIVSHGLSAIAMAMPWPALLAAVWSTTHSDLWLAAVGVARMAPYVLLSWAAGSVGDRFARVSVVVVSTTLRMALLAATVALVATGQVPAAIVTATMVVAVGTPAYPALAAAMPDLVAPHRAAQLTRWLVTLEVSAFVVGPALGGLVLGVAGGTWSVVGAAALAVLATVLAMRLERTPRGQRSTSRAPCRRGSMATLLAAPFVVRSIIAVAVVNGVVGALSVGLLMLAEDGWGAGEREFGLATAALGFGALATPAICWALRVRATAVTAALVLTALPLAATAAVPIWWAALAPLALVGAGATQVECAVTAIIQESVPDHARAFALGVTDTAMVSVAMLGAAAAPAAAAALGPHTIVGLLVVVTAVAALAARSVATPAEMSGRRTVVHVTDVSSPHGSRQAAA